jgi:phosphoribosylformimino-5-aminoimidazole carboxamide ribotide isomerase
MPRKKTQFRPCIDLHGGSVKQIVGGSLTDNGADENFVSDLPASFYANKFREDRLTGGHVIKLGAGNDEAARTALATWPNGLQIGGGINAENAKNWIAGGASHVIVTSWLFDEALQLDWSRARKLADVVSADRVVIDLSCRKQDDGWVVTMNRWQTMTHFLVTLENLALLAPLCSEFLIHAADVEGKSGGYDQELVELLSRFDDRPVTYAGGVSRFDEFKLIDEVSGGKIDVTVGSALDLFGGSGLAYEELVAWNHSE